jgi:hypothetical protein
VKYPLKEEVVFTGSGREVVWYEDEQLSRKVGWYPRPVSWPESMAAIEYAREDQLLEWYRFLPATKNENQMKMINRIIELLFTARRGA